MGDFDGTKFSTERIRQSIRDKYLRNSTVTVVLVGANTWQQKSVDWEISSSLRQTEYNTRSGLLGILLPTYPNPPGKHYDPHTVPPRLYDNIACRFLKFTLGMRNLIPYSHGYITLINGEQRYCPTTRVPRSITTCRAKGGTKWKKTTTRTCATAAHVNILTIDF